MRAQDIRPGDALVLKPERARAYGLGREIRVVGLKPRPGYRTPFVEAVEGFFEPSDFQRGAKT